MAARTIPFPHPSGIAATGKPNLLLPPPSLGVAKALQPSRRYRGLHLVAVPATPPPLAPRPSSLAQTRAIVAQVGREIEQQAAREGQRRRLQIVHATTASAPSPSAATAPVPARRSMLAILPGLL